MKVRKFDRILLGGNCREERREEGKGEGEGQGEGLRGEEFIHRKIIIVIVIIIIIIVAKPFFPISRWQIFLLALPASCFPVHLLVGCERR